MTLSTEQVYLLLALGVVGIIVQAKTIFADFAEAQEMEHHHHHHHDDDEPPPPDPGGGWAT